MAFAADSVDAELDPEFAPALTAALAAARSAVPLDFSHGATLATSRGVAASDGRFHHHAIDEVPSVLG